MDWTSNLFIVLLLSTITGAIFFLIGRLFKRQAEKDVVFLRFLTVTTFAAYLVPFVYIIAGLGKRLSTITMYVYGENNLFYMTPLTRRLSALLGCLWLGLFLILLVEKLRARREVAELCRGNIPEEDEMIIQVFEEICAELGVNGKVSQCRNDSVKIPCIAFYHGYVVILPLVQYTRKDAEVIFYHELCHYLHRDLLLKTVGCLVALLHVFNPTVHLMMKELDLMCERYCDRAASKKGKDRFTVKEYFQVIFNSLVDDGKKNRYRLFALADDKQDYERRVNYMKDYRANGGLKRKTAAALAVCFLMGSSITSFAAGDGVMDAYQGLAGSTSVKTVAANDNVSGIDEETLLEFAREYDLDPEKVILMDDGIETYSFDKEIFWKIDPGYTIMSSGFYEEVGDIVGVFVHGTPEDVVYQTGLKDPKDVMHYVEGSGDVYHIFKIQMKGKHYFFVSNMSETDYLNVHAYVHGIDKPETDE